IRDRNVTGVQTCALPISEDDDIYTCNRRIYQVEKIDIGKLFKEIVLSDISGKLDLISSIFIIDMDTGCIFHLYDDRGLYLFGPRSEERRVGKECGISAWG